jgi:hypothetical protein
MTSRRLFLLLFFILAACMAALGDEISRSFGKDGSISHYFPPPRLLREQMPPFQREKPQLLENRLDESNWTLMQLLYDADTAAANYDPDSLGAVPTGILFYPTIDRIYISTFHTLFCSTDSGLTWINSDPNPTPHGSYHFYLVRVPNYIYGVANLSAPHQLDTNHVYIAHLNSRTGQGFVRRITLFTPQLALVENPPRKTTNYWLGHISLADSTHWSVLGSWDGSSLFYGHFWVLPSDTDTVRVDSAMWADTLVDPWNWVTGPHVHQNGFLYAVGVHQWVSFDSGRTWAVRPSADEIFDGGVSFVDTLYGWTGGGRISPQSQGWVHRTTDGGHTWSPRLFESDYPIRTVHFVDRQTGFAAGGNYQEGIGGIWSTTDGGETWQEDTTLSSEITVLGSHRYGPAYVDVFAAGYYPDFVGAVWHKRLFHPDTTGSALVARPDTLDFGVLPPDGRDTLSFWLANYGSQPDTITQIHVSDTAFVVLLETDFFAVAPHESLEIAVEFRPPSLMSYVGTILLDGRAQDVPIICRGGASSAPEGPEQSLLPKEPSVSVYPNPGNPNFIITFALPHRADIRLTVHNILGQQVGLLASGLHDAGSYRLIWRADGLPSGVYFVRLDGIPSPKITKLCLVR